MTYSTFTYAPCPGYSVPVVRVSNPSGAVTWTLSFDKQGGPINPPEDISQEVLSAAWSAWVGVQ